MRRSNPVSNAMGGVRTVTCDLAPDDYRKFSDEAVRLGLTKAALARALINAWCRRDISEGALRVSELASKQTDSRDSG